MCPKHCVIPSGVYREWLISSFMQVLVVGLQTKIPASFEFIFWKQKVENR